MYADIFLYIIAFSVYSLYVPQQPAAFTPVQSLVCCVLAMCAVYLYGRLVFNRCCRSGHSPAAHARAMVVAKTGALFVFAVLVLACDVKQVLPVPARGSEFVQNLLGLSVFLGLQMAVWRAALPSYRTCCEPHISHGAYVLWHARMSCALVLPWLLFSVVQDSLLLLPAAARELILGNRAVFFGVFAAVLACAAIFFPWFVVRLWGCSVMPPGAQRARVERVCRTAGVRCAQIYLWNMFGGSLLTAGVLGFYRSFRYILISPALLDLLDGDELDAVVAHEAAHVRHRHMLFYLVFILGYGFLCTVFYELFFPALYASDVFLDLTLRPDGTFGFIFHTVTLLVVAGFLLLYFRILFGFILRAFERQADCAALELTGTAGGIAGALEKIAVDGAASRSAPSWHHYSIAERCAFLHDCEREPAKAARHTRRVRSLVWGYCLIVCLVAALMWGFRDELREREFRTTLSFVEKLSERRPRDAVLHFQLAGLYYEKKLFTKAEKEYRSALRLRPDFYEAYNNLAWLYATCPDEAVRNYPEALRLARIAVSLSAQAYILDTLAECLYVNGLYSQAVIAAEEALGASDDENREHYERQLARFKNALDAHDRPPYRGGRDTIAL